MTTVTITRQSLTRYVATNAAGVQVSVGEDDDQFSPVELLLAALGSCTSVAVDLLTSRRAEPDSFDVEVTAGKVSDGDGSRLNDVWVTFRVRFPEGADGDKAREVLPSAIQRSHDRLCTVGRSLELPTPVATAIE